jgi:hypothetical protein
VRRRNADSYLVPLRATLWLLLAVVAGSAIGFGLGLPGSGAGTSPVAAAPPAAVNPPLRFAPPTGRRVRTVGLDTGGPSSPGLVPLAQVDAETVTRAAATSSASPTSDAIAFNSPYVSDLRFLALPGAAPSSPPPPPAGTTTTTPAPTVPAPTIQDVHAVALTPFSATIAWRTSVPASSRIAYGLDAPVVWTAAGGDSTSHQATVTGLTFSSSYKLAVTAENSGGQAPISEFLLTTPPLSGPVQMTTADGAILLDGQPSFPKMVWGQCPDAVAGNLAVGIDVFMGNNCGTGATLASWLSGRAFVLGNAQAPAAARAGSVGVHLPDEWDTFLPNNLTLDDVLRMAPRTPDAGPRFLTLTNHFYSGAAPLPQGKGMYPALAAGADVLGFDLYPLQNWCRYDSFGDVFDSQVDLVALARGKPTFQWIEARRMDCHGAQLDPTPETVRAETWLSIAGGAHAVGYFPNNWAPEVGAEIARSNHEIQSLAPALVEPATAASVTLGSTVRVGAREHNGAVYVIAVNASRSPASAKITVPALGNRPLRSLDGAHALTASGGSFTDSFGPLEVRIYVASPQS